MLDYLPFGTIRIDQKAGEYTDQRKYGGHEYDVDTGLSYMDARYYDGAMGRFLSEDPAYLLIGDKKKFEDKYDRTLQSYLTDPQNLNSYSYVNNNPLKYTDPDGEIIPLLIAGAAAVWAVTEVALSAYDMYDAAKTVTNPNASWTDKGISVAGVGIGLIAPGGGYGAGSKEALQISKQTNSAGKVLMRGVNNIDVLGLIKDNYKAGSIIGKSGSTADAVRHELLTGEMVGGKLHSIKAQEQINRISNLFNKYGSQLNSQEKKVLNQISNDLKSALKTKR